MRRELRRAEKEEELEKEARPGKEANGAIAYHTHTYMYTHKRTARAGEYNRTTIRQLMWKIKRADLEGVDQEQTLFKKPNP